MNGPDLLPHEVTIIRELAERGCCHCHAQVLKRDPQQPRVVNVGWVRTDRAPEGFELYCLDCLKLLAQGKLDVEPPQEKLSV